jgi:tetratricopeptide (TPR) repeat protein
MTAKYKRPTLTLSLFLALAIAFAGCSGEDTGEQDFAGTYTYTAADYDTKLSARVWATTALRSTLFAQAFDYINASSDSAIFAAANGSHDSLRAVAALALRMDITNEKWDSIKRAYHIEAHMLAVRSEAFARMAAILKDKSKTTEALDLMQRLANAKNELERMASDTTSLRSKAGKSRYLRQATLLMVDEYVTRGHNADIEGIYDLALKSYRRAALLDSTNVKLHDFMGNIYRKQQNYAKFVVSYQKCIELDSAYVRGYHYLGLGHTYLKDYPKAIACYQKALSLDSTFLASYHNIAYTYSRMGSYSRAVEYYHKLLPHNPENVVDIYFNLGNSYRNMGYLTKSITYYEQSFAVDTTDARPYINIGEVYFRLKQYDRAIEAFKKFLALNPNSSYTGMVISNVAYMFNTKADTLQNAIFYDSAAYYCAWALKLYPTVPQNHIDLGNVYMCQKKYDKALPCFQKVAELDSANIAIHLQIGQAYLGLGEYEKAKSSVQLVLDGYADTVTALVVMADIYLQQHDMDNATSYYQRAAQKGDKGAAKWLHRRAADRRGGRVHGGRGTKAKI